MKHAEKHDHTKVECHLLYIRVFEEMASCVVLHISVLRTQQNKVTTMYSENSQHHTALLSPPASFQEDLQLEEAHSAETAVIVDNNLLIPWHTK